MGRRSLERGLLALSIALALGGGLIASIRAREPERPKDPVVAYLDALARHDYRTAYSLTDLPKTPVRASGSGITRAHFEAFEKSRPLRSWRRIGNDAELTYRDGSRSRVSFALNDGAVHVPVSGMVVTSDGGPLPGFAVDGVAIPLPRLSAKGPAVGQFRYRYGILLIRGTHRLDVGAGPATNAIRLRVAVTARGRATQTLRISLKPSARGQAAATSALRKIIGTCPDDLCLVSPCGSGTTQYVLEAGYDLIIARELVHDVGPKPRNGWAIAVTFVDQAQPAVFKGGSEHTSTLRARYTFGFVSGIAPRLLERCWTSSR